MTFLRFNDKYKVKPNARVPQGKISVHLEEQKLPPMGDDLVLKSATVVPMLSSEWQAQQDPDGGGLAGPVAAQQGVDLARADLEGEAAQDLVAAEAAPDIVEAEQGSHGQ